MAPICLWAAPQLLATRRSHRRRLPARAWRRRVAATPDRASGLAVPPRQAARDLDRGVRARPLDCRPAVRCPRRVDGRVFNGVDVARYAGEASVDEVERIRASLGVGGQEVMILTVGRLTAQKGLGDLLSAFAKASPNLPSARLLIPGDGPERPRLKETIASLELGDRVRLLGNVERPDDLYRAADLSCWRAGTRAFRSRCSRRWRLDFRSSPRGLAGRTRWSSTAARAFLSPAVTWTAWPTRSGPYLTIVVG